MVYLLTPLTQDMNGTPSTPSPADAAAATIEKNKKRNMLKARLRRQCEMKKGCRLLVPKFVHEMWKNGNRDDLAERFEQCNFNTEPCHSNSYSSKNDTHSPLSSHWYSWFLDPATPQASSVQPVLSALLRKPSSPFARRSRRRKTWRGAKSMRVGIPVKKCSGCSSGTRNLAYSLVVQCLYTISYGHNLC